VSKESRQVLESNSQPKEANMEHCLLSQLSHVANRTPNIDVCETSRAGFLVLLVCAGCLAGTYLPTYLGSEHISTIERITVGRLPQWVGLVTYNVPK
jgi:hypothetical protein